MIKRISLRIFIRFDRNVGAISYSFLKPALNSRILILVAPPKIVLSFVCPSEHALFARYIRYTNCYVEFCFQVGHWEVVIILIDQFQRVLIKTLLGFEMECLIQRTQIEFERS